MTFRTAALVTVTLAAVYAPAWGQSDSLCRGAARDMERDLTLRGGQMSAQDRILMERRLSDSSSLCARDPGRASSDLEQMRRDLTLQAQRPPAGTPPGSQGTRGMWE